MVALVNNGGFMYPTLGHLEANERGMQMVGKIVKFSVPSLHGKSLVAGTIKRILPNGQLEVKAQHGGYYILERNQIKAA